MVQKLQQEAGASAVYTSKACSLPGAGKQQFPEKIKIFTALFPKILEMLQAHLNYHLWYLKEVKNLERGAKCSFLHGFK